jgi:hypothetical protein
MARKVVLRAGKTLVHDEIKAGNIFKVLRAMDL